MEQRPSDIRIDELADRTGRFEADVKDRFDKVDRRFERFEDKVDGRFDEVDARFDKIDARFDRWGKVLAGGVGTIAGSVVVKVLGL